MSEFIFEYILPILFIILIIVAMFVILGMGIHEWQNNIFYREEYIRNIEEKLNIYEQSYEEFCLEDSLKQSDQYE